jgi:hypothetical protein
VIDIQFIPGLNARYITLCPSVPITQKSTTLTRAWVNNCLCRVVQLKGSRVEVYARPTIFLQNLSQFRGVRMRHIQSLLRREPCF